MTDADNSTEFLKRRVDQLISERLKSSNGGAGGGSGNTLEPRIAKLEATAAHIQSDIAEIKTDAREFRSGIGSLKESAAALTERVAHLPSKGFIVSASITSLALLAAIVLFQANLQKTFGLLALTQSQQSKQGQ